MDRKSKPRLQLTVVTQEKVTSFIPGECCHGPGSLGAGVARFPDSLADCSITQPNILSHSAFVILRSASNLISQAVTKIGQICWTDDAGVSNLREGNVLKMITDTRHM